MIVSRKTHLRALKDKDNIILSQERRIEQLENEQTLTSFLEAVSERLRLGDKDAGEICFMDGNNFVDMSLSDDVAVYVPDYFGGKVIKQEATKLVELDEEGNTTYHLTAQKPDKGHSYKLIRK